MEKGKWNMKNLPFKIFMIIYEAEHFLQSKTNEDIGNVGGTEKSQKNCPGFVEKRVSPVE